MRLFGFLGTVVTLAIGMYIYSLQIKAIDPSTGAANPQEAALINGVRSDLISIGNAERSYMAREGRYVLLEELRAGNYVTIKEDRPPYVYDVEVSAGNFRATATRTTKGAPAQLWISDDLQIQTSD